MRLQSRFTLLLLGCLLVSATSDSGMRAGVWRETRLITIETVDGKPEPPGAEKDTLETTEDCYTPDEMDEAKFFGATAADHGCDKLVFDAKHGLIQVSGTCSLNGVPFTATGQGRYDAAKYSLTIRLNARIEGHAVIANGRFTGQYLHECPASDSI